MLYVYAGCGSGGLSQNVIGRYMHINCSCEPPKSHLAFLSCLARFSFALKHLFVHTGDRCAVIFSSLVVILSGRGDPSGGDLACLWERGFGIKRSGNQITKLPFDPFHQHYRIFGRTEQAGADRMNRQQARGVWVNTLAWCCAFLRGAMHMYTCSVCGGVG